MTAEATARLAAASQEQPVPFIRTELPGPRARELIARDAAVASPSLTRAYPLVAASGSGYVVTDVDGNRFLDFAAGIAVCSTGHCHPAVVEAIRRQAGELIHIAPTDFYEPRFTEFMERLVAIAPFGGAPARVFLTNSGTEAIEGAIKLARYHTGRPGIIAFEGGFHGRTMGALSLTNSKIKQRAGFGPLLPMVYHAPFPQVRAWQEAGGDGTAELETLETTLLGRLVAPHDVAAIVVEPIQGEGGYFPAPAAFLRGLRDICDRHGILLVADEIQSGMGRTGRWWAIEHAGVEPDIVATAKGIASGMPMGAFIARAELWDWPPGAHGSTFAGNPVCCAAGMATLELIGSQLADNAARMGERLHAGLEAACRGERRVRDVRGIGLMQAVEFTDHDAANAVQQEAFRRGLLVLEAGEAALRFSPPLIVDEAAVDGALAIFAAALRSAPARDEGIDETGG